MSERRFTDKDVSLILRRAAELDRRSVGPEVGPRGLSLGDLQEIAVEAGIDPAMVSRAVGELDGKGAPSPAALLGPATASREVRAVPVELGRDSLGDLVRVVDARVPAQGTVGEALGSVRWTSPGRFLSHQVSLEPGEGETVVRVEERYADRVRALLHVIPAVYGAGIGLPVGVEVLGGAGAGVLLAGALGAAAWALGGVAWRVVAARSRRRVRALADELAERAEGLGAG